MKNVSYAKSGMCAVYAPITGHLVNFCHSKWRVWEKLWNLILHINIGFHKHEISRIKEVLLRGNAFCFSATVSEVELSGARLLALVQHWLRDSDSQQWVPWTWGRGSWLSSRDLCLWSWLRELWANMWRRCDNEKCCTLMISGLNIHV